MTITVDGDGEVSIGSITGGTVGQIIAKASDLTGTGVTLGAAARTLIFDDLLAGTAIVAAGKIGKLTLGDVTNAVVTAPQFGKVKIQGNLTDSLLLAGAKLGSDRAPGGPGSAADTFATGSIANLRVEGTVAGSVVGAGLSSSDAIFKNADDQILGGKKSKVGALRIDGTASQDSFFAAGNLPATVKIGGTKVKPATDARFRAEPDVTVPVVSAWLLTDTGLSARDGITSDPTISGTLTDASSITKLRAGLDSTTPGNFIDVLSLLAPDRSFVFPLGQIEIINGAPLADGTHTLHIQAEDFAGNSTTSDFTFTLDTTAPGFSFTPLDATQDVLPRELVFAIFDEPVAVGAFTAGSFVPDTAGAIVLEEQGAPLAGRIVLDVTGERLTFVPAANLPGNAELVATLAMEKVFDLAGNPVMPLPSETQFRTINTLGIPGTKVVGFVFDTLKDVLGNNIPLAGATVRIANSPGNQTVTDANGRFELNDTPAGKLMIDVDGGTIAAPAGTFYPSVAEVVFAAPGQMNTFPAAVFLPLANTSDFVTINNAPGAITPVTNPDQLPGWQLMVPGGSVERRDGTIAEQIQIAFVAPDRLPAPLPPSMTPPVVITVQTQGGADIFRQPVPLTAPNLEGLAPGEKTTLWDFDHARGFFVPVGLATVSADGQTVTTDPDSGVVRPGWHFILRLAAGDVTASDGSETKNDGRPLSDEQKEMLRKLRNDIALSLAKAALEVAGSISPLGGPLGIGVQIGLGSAADAVGQMRDANGADDPNSLADRIGMALDFDGKAALTAQIMAESLLAGSDAAVNLTKQTYRDALNGNQAAIDSLSRTGNTLTMVKNNIGALKELSKFASKINNLAGGLQALDDARRAYDQAQRVLQILKDPPGDATSLMIKGIEEQQAIIAENLSEVAEAVGRGTEALLLGAQLSLLGATLPMRADQLTAGQQAQIQDLTSKYQSAHSRSNAAAGGGVVQDELEAAVTAANKLKEIIIPPAENRVFYKLQMPDGSTVRGSAFGAEAFRFDFVPGSGTVTASAVDPIKGSFGTTTFALPALNTLGRNTVTFSPLPITLFRTDAADANGNGLPDNIDDVISATTPSRATVIDLQGGLDPVAAGLVNLGTLGRAVTRGNAIDVAAGPEEVAYVATSFRTVHVMDVSRPTNPVIIADVTTEAFSERIVSRGERFAVAEAGVVEVFDASEPTAPQRILRLGIDSPAVALGANHVLLASGANLQSFDVETGAMTSQVALSGSGSVQDIFLTNDIVFAVRADSVGRTVSVASAALGSSGTLTMLDSFQFNNTVVEQAARLAGGDGVLFVSNITTSASGQNPGFATLNIADPADLQLIGGPTAQTARALAPDGSGRAIAISNNAAQPSVLIFDVSNPANTGNLSTTLGTLIQPEGVTLAGNLGLVAIGSGGLSVVRYAAPDTGTQAPTVAITTSPGMILTEGNRLGIHIAATDDVQVQRVELVIQGDNVIASDATYPFDLDLVGPSGLPDGQAVTLVARAIDSGGNVALSTPVNLTYQAIPPHVIGTTPAPGSATQLAVSTIMLNFDEALDRSNVTTASFTLKGAGADGLFDNADDVTVPLSGVRFNTAGSQAILSLPAALEIGKYRVTAAAANLTDRGGNRLDGEFTGAFPSGNGAFGGDFVYSFDVAAKVSSLFPVPVFPSGGRIPISLASGDFDGDGHADLASANGSDGTLGILFGTGGSSFAAGPSLTAGDDLTSVDAGDLNGDGNADLVAALATFNMSRVALFLSNGDGTFATPAFIEVPSIGNAGVLKLADLTGDSKLDILVAGSSALINNGSGTFTPAASTPFATNARFTVGDVNGDNHADVFGVNSLVLGNGNGTFGAPRFFNDVEANAAQLVDVTGDNRADLVYTSGSLSGGTINVMPGNGDGTFGAKTSLDAGNNTTLLLADINGDSRLDAVTTGGTTGLSAFLGIPGGFAPAVDYTVPLDAFDAVLGDWDTDGKLDLAVTDLSGVVGLIFGQGNGDFATTSDFVQVYRPAESLALGDVNGDGDLDLIAADTDFNSGRESHSITVYFGNGNHGFTRAVTFDAVKKPNAVAVGDLNSDTVLDVVTANTTDDSVSVLLGNGAGSFGTATQLAAFDLPKAVRLADVTGDSRLDIVVGSGDNFGIGTISILPGNGNGTFGTRTDIGNGDALSLLLTKDVNGDNRQDIITASFSTFVTTTTGVTVRLGNGNGTFGAASKIAIPLLTGVTLADVNKDNVLDLLTGDIDASTNTLGVRLGTGTGVFAAPITKTVAVQPDRILVADFTRDTNPDIVLSSSFSNVQLLTGSGDGRFANPVNSGVSAPLFFAANMGPDTDLDLITGEPPGLSIRPGNGDGTFAPQTGLLAGFQPSAVALGDFNCDGRPDAVTANIFANTVSVLNGATEGVFGLPVDYPVGRSPMDVKLADFNGDTLLDIVTANSISNDASLLLGTPGGGFAPAVSLALGMFVGGTMGVAVGDVNGDLLTDIVTANRNSANVTVLLGNGNGTFAAPARFAVAGFANDVSLGDLDGDGDLDVITADGGSPAAVSVLTNNGSGSFSAPVLLSETVFVRHAALGDLDGDGDLDIAITRVDNSGNGSISIRLNNGSGSFGGATIIAAGDFSPDKLVLGDVTRDGRLDILTTNSDLGSFTVLVNTGGGVFELPRNFAAVSVAGLALANLNGDNKPDVVIVDGNSSLLVSLNAG